MIGKAVAWAVIGPGGKIMVNTVSVDRESAEHFLGAKGFVVRRVIVSILTDHVVTPIRPTKRERVRVRR